MKQITILFVSLLMVACSTQKDQKQTCGEQLLERLQALQEKGVMTGHQDDPF